MSIPILIHHPANSCLIKSPFTNSPVIISPPQFSLCFVFIDFITLRPSSNILKKHHEHNDY